MLPETTCPTCGFNIQPGQGECPNCGTVLEHQPEIEPAPVVLETPAAPQPKKKKKPNTHKSDQPSLVASVEAHLKQAFAHEESGELDAALASYQSARDIASGTRKLAYLVPLLDRLTARLPQAASAPVVEEWPEQGALAELYAAAQALHAAPAEQPPAPLENAPLAAQQDLSPLLVASLLGWLDREPAQHQDRENMLIGLLEKDEVLPYPVHVAASKVRSPRVDLLPASGKKGFDWENFLYWVAVNATAVALVVVIANLFMYRYYPWYVTLPAFAAPGLVLGALQWQVLKDYLEKGWLWILLSSLGVTIIFTSATYIAHGYPLQNLMLSAALAGLLLGGAQYYFFFRKVLHGEYWIIITTAGWFLSGLALQNVHVLWALFVGLPILGVLTGLAVFYQYGDLVSSLNHIFTPDGSRHSRLSNGKSSGISTLSDRIVSEWERSQKRFDSWVKEGPFHLGEEKTNQVITIALSVIGLTLCCIIALILF